MTPKFNKLMWRLMEGLDDDGGAGDAAPAAPPPQEPTAPFEDFEAGGDEDWGALSSDVDEIVTEEAAPSAPATTPPAAEPPAQPVTPPTPAAEQPQGIQPEPVAPATPPQPTAPQPTQEQVQAAERAYAAQLENLYRFDEETALKLQTEPEKVLPALAAKLHLDVMKTVMSQMQGLLPQLVETQTESVKRNVQAKEQFYGAWPELKGYEQQVLQVGHMFRQLNPNASAEEAIKRIGELAMTSLGLTRQQQVNQQQQNVPPASNVFQPAVPGRVNPPAPPASEWEELITDDD
jgi:hypothetical protein